MSPEREEFSRQVALYNDALAKARQAPPDSPWMTYADVAKHYCASRQWVYDAARKGDIPSPLRVGGKQLFKRATILAFDIECERRAQEETEAKRAARA